MRVYVKDSFSKVIHHHLFIINKCLINKQKMSNFMLFLKWYLSLNGILYFSTDLKSFQAESTLTVLNDLSKDRVIKYMEYYYIREDGQLVSIKKGDEKATRDERLALIDPNVKSEELLKFLGNSHTSFFMSSDKVPKEDVLAEHYLRLSTVFKDYNLVLIDEKKSEDIKNYFFYSEEINLTYKLRPHTPLIHKSYILSCLITISICVLSIFYLVCGIYSSKNPIVTEFELNRFQVVKYNEIAKTSMDSCLICFDPYSEEDDIRILLCKHYFHKECVDKWLCEQSSRCPYCRCTNKYYDEFV